MKDKIKVILVLVLFVGLLLGPHTESIMALNPTPDDPLTIRLGYVDPATWPGEAPAPDPEHAVAATFEQYVESETDGAIQVERYPGAELGESRELYEMTQTGTIEASVTTGVIGPFFPEWQLIYLPFAFEDSEIAYWIFENSDFWNDLMEDMKEETGTKFLGMGQNGFRNFTNNVRPIHEPEDMEGLSFRVMESPIYIEMVEALGASAEPIAWGELYTALETGVVDGQENPLNIIYFVGNLHEVQDYLTMTQHVWSEAALTMNAEVFDNLPEEMQNILERAGRKGARAAYGSQELSERLIAYDALDEEVEIQVPSSEELEKFREVAQPAVLEYLKEEIGEETVNEFLETIEKAENVLGGY